MRAGHGRGRLPGVAPLRAFVGRRLDVLCIDNFYTWTKKSIAHLLASPHFELMRHDITFPLYVEVDGIYNTTWKVIDFAG